MRSSLEIPFALDFFPPRVDCDGWEISLSLGHCCLHESYYGVPLAWHVMGWLVPPWCPFIVEMLDDGFDITFKLANCDLGINGDGRVRQVNCGCGNFVNLNWHCIDMESIKTIRDRLCEGDSRSLVIIVDRSACSGLTCTDQHGGRGHQWHFGDPESPLFRGTAACCVCLMLAA